MQVLSTTHAHTHNVRNKQPEYIQRKEEKKVIGEQNILTVLYDVASTQIITEKERKKIARENSYAPTIEGDTE
jgi:hypothetical protein